MPVINQVPALVAQRFGGQDKVNLSQVERETGLNYITVSRWINNQVNRADFPTLAVWCKYLGVGVGEILVYESGDEGVQG